MLSLVLLALLAVSMIAGRQQALAEGQYPVVGVRDDIVNFGFLNETAGKYYGLEIDLAKDLEPGGPI